MRTDDPARIRRWAGIIWLSGMIGIMVGLQRLDQFTTPLRGMQYESIYNRSGGIFLILAILLFFLYAVSLFAVVARHAPWLWVAVAVVAGVTMVYGWFLHEHITPFTRSSRLPPGVTIHWLRRSLTSPWFVIGGAGAIMGACVLALMASSIAPQSAHAPTEEQ